MSRSRWVFPSLIYSFVLVASCFVQWTADSELTDRELTGALVFAIVVLNAAMAFGVATILEVADCVKVRYGARRRVWSWGLSVLGVAFSWVVASELVQAVSFLKRVGYPHVLAVTLAGGVLITLNALRTRPYGSRRLNLILAAVLLVVLLWAQDRYKVPLRDARYAGVSAALLLITGLTALRVFERLFAPRESSLRTMASVIGPFLVFVALSSLSSPVAVRQLYFAALIPGRMVFALYLPQLLGRRGSGDSVAHASELARRLPSTDTDSEAPEIARQPKPAELVILGLVDAARYDSFSRYAARPDSKLHHFWKESCFATVGYSPSSATVLTLNRLAVRPGPQHELWLAALRRAQIDTALVMDGQALAYLDETMPFKWSPLFETVVRLKRTDSTTGRVTSILPGVRDVIASERHPLFVWAHFFEVHEWSTGFPDATRETYDESIAIAGDELATLLDQLIATGRRFTLFVLGDHGEGIDHFSAKHHNNFLYEPLVRVPFFMWTNAHPCSAESTDLRTLPAVSTMVVGKLVLDEFGIPSKPSGPTTMEIARAPIFLATDIQYGVIRWPYKMIVSPWFTELFNIEADPNELHDLASTDRRTGAELTVLLNEWAQGTR